MALRFNGTSESATRGTSLPSFTSFTLMCWVKIMVDRNTYQCFMHMGSPNYYYVGTTSSGTDFQVYNNQAETDGTNMTVGQWYHVAMTCAGTGAGQLLGYLNGVLDVTNAGNASNSGARIGFGADPDNNWLNGRVAAGKIYGAVLTAAEIQNEMRYYTPQRTANLNSWYPLIAPSVTSALTDFGGSALTLTANGSLSIEDDGPPIAWARRRLWVIPTVAGGVVLEAQAGSYSLGGQQATLRLGRLLEAQAGSSSASGVEASLEYGRELIPQEGAYTLTGQDVTLSQGRRVLLQAGSVVFDGPSVGLLRGARIGLDAGSYTLTGQDLSLQKGRTLTLAVGSYTLSGQAMTLVATRQLIPQAGSVTLDGQSLSLERGYPLTIQAGSYTLSGQEVTLRATRFLIPQAGSYALTGGDAELIYQTLGTYLLQAQAGSYSLTGPAVTLLSGRVLTLEAGSYSLIGDDGTFELVRLLTLEAGAYVLTGDDVELLLGRRLAITPGAYVLVGLPQTLSYSEEAPTGGGVGLISARVRRLRLLGILQGDEPAEGWVRQTAMRPWWLRGRG